ncbi:LytTR family DNA-binding domain-containing protein [Cytophagaceae bacterium DM2B3-1]|uniref:LytTR family DNA-binding domain-containing protein n=1 Tax=Xanthocytophaga flava TaxID=3048013 RepID=A0ABT7CXZ2_9BACT|nr:LytTR family DNA-binding domain-containing protein [Xanthocytophaga flavus]MDJ1498617.1 LytTR family DNA-binding domain-containing protein [Xanthocytophaga flavus]
MRVLILEDESLAAERLQDHLRRYDASIQVEQVLDTVEEGVQWLRSNPSPDLMLMDIHLADGLSFSIFTQTFVNSPIIFTTAYDQYALQAFKVNSIDYLLKPISYQHLVEAMQKLRRIKAEPPMISPQIIQQLINIIQKQRPNYKSRFLVKFGDRLQYKTVEDVSYFYADGKVVYLVSNENKRFIVDYTLEELEDLLDPTLFHRINRKVIVHLQAVKDMRLYPNSRLSLSLRPSMDTEVVVSRDKVPAFKAWLDQ